MSTFLGLNMFKTTKVSEGLAGRDYVSLSKALLRLPVDSVAPWELRSLAALLG